MKVIGLIGGMSWQSSAEYYRILNEEAHARLGGLHSARVVLYSMDFDGVRALEKAGGRARIAELVIEAGRALRRAGAELLLLCANKAHRHAEALEKAVPLPLVHIADAAGAAARARGLSRVGLLGAKATMEEDFYAGRLARYGLSCLTPPAPDRDRLEEIIFGELVLGKFTEPSRRFVLETTRSLQRAGAEGVVLGCTELPLLVRQEDASLPLFDTTRLHALAALDLALGSDVRPVPQDRSPR